MWFNGFMVVIDMALEKLGQPLLRGQREALILGAFREDVCALLGSRWVFQSPSLTHFYRRRVPGGFVPFVWPGPVQRTEQFFRRAVGAARRGRLAYACVQLGRAAHPLIDMSCPVHAQSVAHTTDPFEWCVEVMDEELRRLPAHDVGRPGCIADIVEGLALFARLHVADKTNNPWGRLLRHLGHRRSLPKALAREQARVLIPRAAGHTAALFELFLERIDTCALDDSNGLAQTLRSLQLSRAAVIRWLAQLEQFCRQHGGARRYGNMLELIARCRAALPETTEWLTC